MDRLYFKSLIVEAIKRASCRILSDNIKEQTVELNIPIKEKYGDLTTNFALVISKKIKKSPLVLAEEIVEFMGEEFKKLKIDIYIDKIQVVPPGFINIFISERLKLIWLNGIYTDKYYENLKKIGKKTNISVEFVSANPTGPLTIAHARQAVIGDCISRIYRFCGYKVANEYYINDEGRQIKLLGESVKSRCKQLLDMDFEFPLDGYKGTYIKEIAECFLEKYSHNNIKQEKYLNEVYEKEAIKQLMAKIKYDLENLGVNFDLWPKQSQIANDKSIKNLFHEWKKKGYIYNKKEAVWFKSTIFGDSKDRVLIKKDGEYTYFAPDIIYHQNKLLKNDLIVNIWGPDHHGYIPRIHAAIKAMGYSLEKIKILIVQLTTVYNKGQPLSMSKREGEFVSLRDILDAVGKDVSRIFLLMRKSDSHLEFDLELAKKTSMDNPVYYIQYAYARICSIVEKAKENNVTFKELNKLDLRLRLESEKQIINKLIIFIDEILITLDNLEPYRLLSYLQDLAALFHKYYAQEKILGEDKIKTLSRFYLVVCVKNILEKGLELLGVSTPENM